MKTYLLFSFTLILGLTLWTFACKTSDLTPETGQLQVQLDNVVGSQDLVLGTGSYTNGSGEPFSVTTLNYYLSNFRFRRADGSEYVVPQDSSYFLVKESDKVSQSLTFHNVPVGTYSAVTFTIGVDSLRSTMNLSRRTGVLDPAGSATAANDMYWEWNSGYIFLKLEGISLSAPVDATGLNTFRYHIGFFGGLTAKTINNIKTVTLSLGAAPAVVNKSNGPQVVLKGDVLKLFDGPAAHLSIAQYPEVMVTPYSAIIANNYSQMFRYDRTIQSTLN